MSWLQSLTIDSFHKYNPDWKIIIYVPIRRYSGTQRFIPEYKGKDYFYSVEAKEYIQIKNIDLKDYNINENLHDILRSDIFRYKILYEFGGVWSDFDIIWLKPISELPTIDYLKDVDLDNMSDTVCMSNYTSGYHNISVMIHEKNSEFIKSLISMTDTMQSKLPNIKLGHQTFGTTMLNKMYPNFSDIPYNSVIPIKYETIYPYSINNLVSLYKIKILSYINDNVLCIHWFNGHVLTKRYINENMYNYDCSMTSILKKENWI
jgi:mannosyltransferase OCH1-like enzyme